MMSFKIMDLVFLILKFLLFLEQFDFFKYIFRHSTY